MASQMLHIQNSYHVELSTAVEQNYKGQDVTISGTTALGKNYIAVFDGHGSDAVTFALRDMQGGGNFNTIMEEDDPVQVIQKKLMDDKVCKEGVSSGATITGALLDRNQLKIFNCGDSRTFVFRNGILEFVTVEHFSGNLSERENSPYGFKPSTNFKAVSETLLQQTQSDYVIVDPITKPKYDLALTRALGHNGLVNPVAEFHTMAIEQSDEIVVVSMSDGCTDMLIYDEENIREADVRMIYELSAEEFKNKIQERWGQIWSVHLLAGRIVEQQWRKTDFDDVGVARMVIRPKA
jgi:serine/threonine protein phosphatase PrpC